MTTWGRVKANKVFKFFGSVQLAIPLLVTILIAITIGTFVEARYDATMAGLKVYRAPWFSFLMVLLWINIFMATILRIPFRKNHTGFVIVHLGLLTLLIGGWMTNDLGIDGSLRVVEGEKANRVWLQNKVIKWIPRGGDTTRKVHFTRRGSEQDRSDLAGVSRQLPVGMAVEKFLPFAEKRRNFVPVDTPQGGNQGLGALGVGFLIESPMFGKVSQWLHEQDQPQLQMGPATFRLEKGEIQNVTKIETHGTDQNLAKRPNQVKKTSDTTKKEPVLIVTDLEGKELKKIPVSQLQSKSQVVGKASIVLKEVLEQAIVGDGGVIEGGQKGANPALVVSVTQGSESLKEVIYARFANFTLHENGLFGMRLRYEPGDVVVGEEDHTGHAHGPTTSVGGNLIRFIYQEGVADRMRVVLEKNGEQVLSQEVLEGDTVVTPWMGLKLTLGKMAFGGNVVDEAIAVVPEIKGNTPPSAILIGSNEMQIWLVEGEYASVAVKDKFYDVYYGPDSIELPFEVQLEKFHKKDYPGTETPMSFESDVLVLPSQEAHKISMNEPLKKDGFTLYQSSYELNPGQKPASIFSVNRDPGRWVKYLGSFILGLGIIVFTLMRSRWYLKRSQA